MSTEGALTPALLDLMEHEKGIEQSVADVGWHLTQIRDGRKYRAAGYSDFDTYCRERWGWSRQHAARAIEASAIRAELTPIGDTRSPEIERAKESQLRPLTPLRDDPDEMRAAWDDAVEQAGGQPTAEQVRDAVEKRREPKPVSKPSPAGLPPHPAPFHPSLLPIFAELLDGHPHVLDPFAGTGRIHQLTEQGFDTVGVEIETEWAAWHPRTEVGNALDLRFEDGSFDAICTSPTYGNRFADNYNAYDPESRRTYRIDLGHDLAEGSSAGLQWGDEYRTFHRQAWTEATRVLRSGGRFVLNIKDHIRDGKWQDVSAWHIGVLNIECELEIAAIRPLAVVGQGTGANHDRRSPAELVIALDKP